MNPLTKLKTIKCNPFDKIHQDDNAASDNNNYTEYIKNIEKVYSTEFSAEFKKMLDWGTPKAPFRNCKIPPTPPAPCK